MAKILLVEDDPLMVRMYQRKLVNDGYDVAVAVNGEEGMVKIRSFHPDLVLLDIMMPKLNGLQVLERTKADPTISSIPIMLLTNLGGSEEDIERGLELGAVAYLVKSAYRPDEVISKVKEVLAGYTHGKEVPLVTTTAAAERVLESTMQRNPAPAQKAPVQPQTPPQQEPAQQVPAQQVPAQLTPAQQTPPPEKKEEEAGDKTTATN